MIASELTVLPFNALNGNVNTIISSSRKKWTDETVEQLSKKLSIKKENLHQERKLPVYAEAHFPNGSIAGFIFLPERYTLFQIHEALRDNVTHLIESSESISFILTLTNDEFNYSEEYFIDALASLCVLQSWRPPYFGNSKMQTVKTPAYGFYTSVPADEAAKIIKEAEIKSHATNKVRTLAMRPHNKCSSGDLVDEARAVAGKTNSEFIFLNTDDLENLGAGAFLAVLQTEKSDGGIAILKRIGKAGKKKEICIVGKGVVMDTGGLDVKTDSGIYGMHRDKTGAAVALYLYEALTKLNKNITVTCFLAVGENLIGPKSYKPGDVVKSLSGKTIEVKNTDAEGRLMLLDTLAMANKEVGEGALVLDFATLTGTALDVAGPGYGIAMTNKEDEWVDIVSSGKDSGERVHVVPITEHFEDEIYSSDIADLSQCTLVNYAEHSHAGALLSKFISRNKTYIHLDLSAEIHDGGLGLVSSDVTGFGVRWALSFIELYLGSRKRA